jgi:phosphoribosylformylglycinamidine cyclo-ligase
MTDYASSGVNLDRAAAAKSRIAAAARTTFGPQVLTDVGHFGGFFALSGNQADNVLVASADGVGTKLLLGIRLCKISGLGRDLVQHCINDILMCGARPLFFLDYMAFGRLDPDVAGELAESLAAACRDHGVALIGGETAEMPGLYEAGHFDLAGTIIGSVRRDRIFDGSKVKVGDTLIGIASNGLHTNGYSLARRVFEREIESGGLNRERLSDGSTLADALMRPHRCYLPTVGSLLDDPALHALSHITGGGIEENTLRVIPKGMKLDIDWRSWPRPELFGVIQEHGSISEDEMRRVFNLGIGVIMAVEPASASRLVESLKSNNEQAMIIGRISA